MSKRYSDSCKRTGWDKLSRTPPRTQACGQRGIDIQYGKLQGLSLALWR